MRTNAFINAARSTCTLSRRKVVKFLKNGKLLQSGCLSSKKDIPQESNSPTVDQRHNGNVIIVKVPQMGESITSGTMGQWFKQLSEFVKADEVVTTIDTDKVTYRILFYY